jgi:hypothetical protein
MQSVGAESDAVPLTFAYTCDNWLSATARLSQLLPAVLENDLPIKGTVYISHNMV